jgi:hypothetical protein
MMATTQTRQAIESDGRTALDRITFFTSDASKCELYRQSSRRKNHLGGRALMGGAPSRERMETACESLLRWADVRIP